jgi:hypothetical protein
MMGGPRLCHTFNLSLSSIFDIFTRGGPLVALDRMGVLLGNYQ